MTAPRSVPSGRIVTTIPWWQILVVVCVVGVLVVGL